MTPSPSPAPVDSVEAAEAWRGILAGMKRFGMESTAIDTVDEYFAALTDTGEEPSEAALLEALEPFRQFAEGLRGVPDHIPMTNGSPMARSQLMAHHFKALLNALAMRAAGKGTQNV